MRRTSTSLHPSHTRMLPTIHPTSNGIETVVQWAMQQIPAFSLHSLAEPMPRLMRLLLCLLVPGALRAPADYARKAQTPRGGNYRRTPQTDRHTRCMPFPIPTRLWSHCGTPLIMQVRKRSFLPLNSHWCVRPLGNTLSALLNIVLRVTRAFSQRGRFLLHLRVIEHEPDTFFFLSRRPAFCGRYSLVMFRSYYCTSLTSSAHSFFFP